MGRLSKSQILTGGKKLCEDIAGGLSTSYGMVRFASGSPFRRKIGSHVFSVRDGGVCVRAHPSGEVEVLCRIVASYPVSLSSVGDIARQTIEYQVARRGFRLKSFRVVVQSVI